MDIKKLMEEMHFAESEAEKETVKRKIEKEFSKLNDNEKEMVRKIFLESLDKQLEEAKGIIKTVDLAIALSDISQYLSLSQISKNYFGKSKEWLYQRIKGYNINGKPAEFTQADREKFAKALRDIADRLIETSLKIA
jgi:uncharacterized protein YaiI (UPF0178 family)